jgi:hypothetical protein
VMDSPVVTGSGARRVRRKNLPIRSIKPYRTNLAGCADETLLYNNVYTFLPCEDLLRQ